MRSTIQNAVLVTLAALAVSSIALPSQAQSRTRPDSETLQMEVGDQITIPGADVASYSEGTEGVVSVRYDLNDHVLFKLEVQYVDGWVQVFNTPRIPNPTATRKETTTVFAAKTTLSF